MRSKRLIKKYKPLPPHSWEAHPTANHGEVNKSLLTIIITLFVVIALVSLMFLTEDFVGKAIQTSAAGAENFNVYAGDTFSIPILANLGSEKSVAVEFSMSYDPQFLEVGTFTPNDNAPISVIDSLIYDDHQINYSFAGLCDESCSNAFTDEVEIGRQSFRAKQTGTTTLNFDSFVMYSLSDTPIDLIEETQDSLITITTRPEVQPPITTGGSGGGGGCRSEWVELERSVCNSSLKQEVIYQDVNCRRGTKTEIEDCEECKESWICTIWSDCQNNQQIRTCVDEHFCQTTFVKPDLRKSCQAQATGYDPNRIVNTENELPRQPQIQQPISWWQQAWNNYKAYIIALPLSLIVIISLIVLAVHYIKPKRQAYNLDELKDWIDKEKKMGTSDEDIITILKDNTGWDDQEIDEAFSGLNHH